MLSHIFFCICLLQRQMFILNVAKFSEDKINVHSRELRLL